jgi:hypothetical protein
MTRVFSFPVMCFSLLAVVIYNYALSGFEESDIWWHLRDARTLIQNHIFLRSDTYSFTAFGSPWINFEWLAEIPYYLAFRTFGLQGILLMYFAVLIAIFASVYYRACRAGADCKDAAIATLGAICLGIVSMGPRTLLFGWLCLMVLLLVLDSFRRTSRGLWLLPPLFALWINLHGSWIFGFVVLAVTIASGMIEGEWGLVAAERWSRPQMRKLSLVSCASIVALFLNPFGYKLVIYPFDLLLRQQSMMQYIDEWQSVDFGNVNGKLALAMIFAVLAAALFSPKRWRLDEALLTGFAVWSALSHQRFLFFAGLIIAPILAPRLKLFTAYEPELDKPWLNAIIIAGVIASLIIVFPPAAQLRDKVDTKFPMGALTFMQRNHLNGRLFNQYSWGGYIDWNAPEMKPGIDGRADIFVYNGVFNDFLGAMALNNSLATLDKYRIDYVLIGAREPMAYLLARSPAWQPMYSDDLAVLFERAAPGANAEK